MKITFGKLVLVDSPAPIPYRNLRINGQSIPQEVPLYNAAVKKFYDRGNESTEITFEASRLFTSQREAEGFLLQHRLAVRGQQLLTLTAGASGGATTLYLPRAIIPSSQSWPLGSTTFHTYRIIGGIILTTPK